MKKSIYYIIVVILVSGCVNFKKQSLWDSPPEIAEPEHIENVYALNILEDGLNGDVWFTEDIKCIKVENSGEFKSSGEKGVHIKWDKSAYRVLYFQVILKEIIRIFTTLYNFFYLCLLSQSRH